MESTVNERVKAVRNHFGLTQVEFGNKLDTTVTTIFRIEKGESNPRKSTLNAIILQFDINREWLLHGKGEMFSESAEPSPADERAWKDAAYAAKEEQIEFLKTEIEFLRGIVSNLTGQRIADFLKVIDPAGAHSPVNDVRAAA